MQKKCITLKAGFDLTSYISGGTNENVMLRVTHFMSYLETLWQTIKYMHPYKDSAAINCHENSHFIKL